MFDNLIESGRKPERKKQFGMGVFSMFFHGGLIGLAVYATAGTKGSDDKVKVDTTMVLLTQQQDKPPEPQVVLPHIPLKGFQTVIAPDVIPTNIPPINLQEHFDPKDYSGTGVEGGVADGLVPNADAVFTTAVVEEQPEALSVPRPTFPELLKQAGIHGRVMLQAIIDTSGRAEPASIKVLSTPNPGFNQPAINSMRQTLFRPARVHGHAVRVLINMPFDFVLNQH